MWHPSNKRFIKLEGHYKATKSCTLDKITVLQILQLTCYYVLNIKMKNDFPVKNAFVYLTSTLSQAYNITAVIS